MTGATHASLAPPHPATPAARALVRRRATPFRVRVAACILVVAAVLFWLALELIAQAHGMIARLRFPFADNQWSDQTLILQLYHLEAGLPAYGPPRDLTSYDYGPVYLLTLRALRLLLHLPFSIVSFRYISAVGGALSVIPYTRSGFRGRSARCSFSSVPAWCLR
jgi:hypothetical protein